MRTRLGQAPVDCTGGSPTVSVSNSPTTPLEGKKSLVMAKTAVNSQGQGISVPFTINNSDQGKVIRLNFDYRILSGTYSSGDITFWIYDVTNGGNPIQPSASSLLNTGTIEPKDQLEFQSAINSTSYRLCAHISTTSALAYSTQFDNFSLGRTNKSYGSPVIDIKRWTPTGTWTTNANYAGTYGKSGDRIVGKMKVYVTGTPSGAVTNNLFLDLPPGIVADTSKLPDNAVSNLESLGIATAYDASTGSRIVGTVSLNNTTSLRLNFNAATAIGSTTVPFTFAVNDTVEVDFDLPVVGWSASTVMSSDADTRIVNFIGANLTNQAITGGSTNISLTTVKDSHGGWTGSTYIVRVPGDYFVTSGVYTVSSSTDLSAYVNGSSVGNMGTANSYVVSAGGTLLPDLKAGDVISFRGNNSVTLTGQSVARFSITRISGPSQIAASESISARYVSGSGQSIPNTTVQIVDYSTKVWDSHAAVTTGSSWKFTAPTPAEYQVCYGLGYASASWASGNVLLAYIFKNNSGSEYSAPPQMVIPTSGTNSWAPYSMCSRVKLLAGEFIDVRLYHNAGGARSLSTTTSINYIEVNKVGNY
jgi:hypothetical protein